MLPFAASCHHFKKMPPVILFFVYGMYLIAMSLRIWSCHVIILGKSWNWSLQFS